MFTRRLNQNIYTSKVLQLLQRNFVKRTSICDKFILGEASLIKSVSRDIKDKLVLRQIAFFTHSRD